jgi:uncharacterized GH25 family protein
MIKRTLATLAVTLLTVGLPVFAHDYWLEPDAFFLPVGESVHVHLHLGDDFKSEEEKPFQKKPTVKFQLLSAKETQDLAAAGEEGKKPVARVKAQAAGNYLIALERSPQTINLAADKFNAYLAEEGLDAILELRRKACEDKQEGRERYSRYLKALLQVGDQRDDTYKKEVGHRLEIVPQENPYQRKVGAQLTVKVLFEGKPLRGAKLFAHHRAGDKVATQMGTTSREGLAVIKLEKAGSWLIRLVHMRRCEGVADIDWESFWGAYTFGLK